MNTTKQYAIIAAAVLAGTASALGWVFFDKLFVIPQKRPLITQHLKDAGSTEFRNERMAPNGWICGELNSRNGYGAYAGFRRYIVTDGGRAYLEGEGNVVGDPTSAELTIAALELQLERSKAINAARRAGKTPDMKPLTEAEAFASAPARVFSNMWNEGCR